MAKRKARVVWTDEERTFVVSKAAELIHHRDSLNYLRAIDMAQKLMLDKSRQRRIFSKLNIRKEEPLLKKALKELQNKNGIPGIAAGVKRLKEQKVDSEKDLPKSQPKLEVSKLETPGKQIGGIIDQMLQDVQSKIKPSNVLSMQIRTLSENNQSINQSIVRLEGKIDKLTSLFYYLLEELGAEPPQDESEPTKKQTVEVRDETEAELEQVSIQRKPKICVVGTYKSQPDQIEKACAEYANLSFKTGDEINAGSVPIEGHIVLLTGFLNHKATGRVLTESKKSTSNLVLHEIKAKTRGVQAVINKIKEICQV